MEVPPPSKALAAGLHLGSFLALMLIFRHDIGALFRGFFSLFSKKQTQETIFFKTLCVSTCGLLGGIILVYGMKTLFFSKYLFSLKALAILYCLFALALEAVNRWNKQCINQEPRSFPYGDAFIIGMGQVLAMVCSGVSRLGITLTLGRGLGYSLLAATRYSFIMGIPVLGASIVYSAPELWTLDIGKTDFLIMTGATFLSSWPMIHVMLWFAQRGSTMPFTLYRLALGACVLWMHG
jgi:undecaprenyl-diphosphatase